MKKTLSIILASVIIISSLVALALPVSAELIEDIGVWDVMLPAKYNDPEYEYDAPLLHGYNYDENGFHTLAPEINEGYNTKFTVVSREKYDIQNFSMTVVIHDYNTNGDNWISFSAWSDSIGIMQGDTSGKYGDGWTSLIRSGFDGIVNRFESWNQTIGSRSGKQQFLGLDDTQMNPIVFEPILDEETGDFTITFAITDGVVTVNGMPVGSETDTCIADRFKDDGKAYFSVTLNNTNNADDQKPAISLIDVNGEVPYGSDSRPPERHICILPPDEYTEPYIWFDATFNGANLSYPEGVGCNVSYADDDESFLITANEESFYIDFNVRSDVNLCANDFTYIAFIFKNFCICNKRTDNNDLNDYCYLMEKASVYYRTGEPESIFEEYMYPLEFRYLTTVLVEDRKSTWSHDNLYTIAIAKIDYSNISSERVHSLKLVVDSYINYDSEGANTFEIAGAGAFLSGEQLVTFVQDFRELNLDAGYISDIYWPCNHFDWDQDGLCDLCFEEMPPVFDPHPSTSTTSPETSVIETETHPIECYCFDGDKDGYCDFCFRPYNKSDTIFVHPETESSSAEIISESETQTEISDTTEKISDTDVESEKSTTVASDPDSEDIYNGDALIVFSGCESTASFGALSIIAIIGSAALIRKKEE